jgi:type III pantothenate kinase
MEDLVRWPGDGENGERRVDGLAAIVPAGVRPGLIRALDQSMILQPVDWCVFSPLDRWPIANAYATPETVGPDRLAAATGAVRRSPTLPLFVITVGTAVTVNLVTPPASESASQEWGEFRGGTILPGYQAFILSLAKAAPTLAPAVQEILRHEDWTRPGFEILHPDLAGATTAGNLRRGALEGVAGAVGQCLTSMEIEQGFPPGSLPVWVTGGDSHALVRGMESMTTLRRQVFIEPNLVLEGMALALDGLMGPPTFPLG